MRFARKKISNAARRKKTNQIMYVATLLNFVGRCSPGRSSFFCRFTMALSASIADQVSKVSLILTTLKTGTDEHMYKSVSSAQRASIETQMRSGSLSIIDLSVVLEAVNPSSFADNDKKSLETTIAELCMKATATDGVANFERWESLWEFVPAAI